MSRTTSITIGPQLDQFVGSLIESGRFGNTSEVVRAGLRLLEQQEQHTEYLRREIQKGLDSGISNRTFDEIIKDAKRRSRVQAHG